MNSLYILGCGAQKLDHAAPVAEIYTGSLFTASLKHARSWVKDEQIRVLSAKHGLLRLSDYIEPYNVCLDDLGERQRDQLGLTMRAQEFDFDPRLDETARVVILAGADYAVLFRKWFPERAGFRGVIREPLRGLGIGKRIAWLNQNRRGKTRSWPISQNSDTSTLSLSENDALALAAHHAAQWWTNQLFRNVSPPDDELFFLALETAIWQEWHRVYSVSRGEWPEDLVVRINFQNAPGGVIESALREIGYDVSHWWQHAWGDRRLVAYMKLSLNCVTVALDDTERTIWSAL